MGAASTDGNSMIAVEDQHFHVRRRSGRRLPLTALSGAGAPELDLHRKRSDGYACGSSPAPGHTGAAPDSAIHHE